MSLIVSGLLEYTRSFRTRHKKKFGGVRSGDLGSDEAEPRDQSCDEGTFDRSNVQGYALSCINHRCFVFTKCLTAGQKLLDIAWYDDPVTKFNLFKYYQTHNLF